MNNLWSTNSDYIGFNPKVHHISEMLGGRLERFLPYKREYNTLNKYVVVY